MLSQNDQFHTDRFTRGGQIVAHKWRMRWQNLKAAMKVALYVTTPCFLILCLIQQLGYWIFIEFYITTYLAGWLKILTWRKLQPPLITVDHFLRDLMRGSEGLPWAYCKVWQLESTLHLQNGSLFVMKTVKFLKDARVLSLAWQVHKVLLWSGGIFVATIAIMSRYFHYTSRQIEEKKILRGKEIIPLKALAKRVCKSGKSSFIIAPGLPLPEGSENQHTAIMGATRMGKTTCLIHLLKQVRAKNERAVILDSTGELTEKFYRPDKDHLINPLDVRSECWNIWDEQLEPYGYDAWAATVVPDGKADDFWPASARLLLSTTAQKLLQDGNLSMSQILHWSCLQTLGDDTIAFYEGTLAEGMMRPQSEKTTTGIRLQLLKTLSAFGYLKTDKPPFSVTDWVKNTKDSGEWLFLMAKPDQRSTLAPLVASLFNFAFLGLERAGVDFKNRLWMAADEIAGWDFQITGLKRMVTEGAKYGACCVLGFQNKSQIDALYSHAGTKTLLSNCSTKVIFRSQDHETAKDLSLTLGEQEVLSSSEGFSMGAHHMRDGVNLSEQRRVQPTIPATEIMSLNKLEAYVLLPGNFPATKVKFDLPS
jgi:type IV conjugative transfer system coupling protein TraD